MTHAMHENFSREETAAPGSDRSFGFVMAGAISVVTAINLWFEGSVWPWSAALAAIFFAAALLYPLSLRHLNRAWLKFGLMLNKVVSPIVMALLFFGTVLPTALVMRAMRKDPLRLKLQPELESYWIVRQPPGPASQTMKDQF